MQKNREEDIRKYKERAAQEKAKKEQAKKEQAKAVSEPTPQPRRSRPIVADKDRVTRDLPETFMEGDTDQDGQVAFYEWRKWKRAETEDFFAYDHNGDGFLTPRELLKGPRDENAPTVVAGMQPKLEPSSGSELSKSKVTIASKGKTVSIKPGKVDMDSPEAAQGLRMFKLLDRDKSGNVTTEEWERSRKLKPQFENAGIDLTKPLAQDSFVSLYVQLNSKKS